MWLVAGSHLGFAEKSFHSIAMTRNLRASVETSCHRERSVAIYWQADCFHHATSVARGRFTLRLRKNILLGIRE